MISYAKLAKKPKKFQTYTGVTVKRFDSTYRKIEKRHAQNEARRLSRRRRVRAVGAGRTFKLSLKDRVFMFLLFNRCYITYNLCGKLFGIDGSAAFRDIANVEGAVKSCMRIPAKMVPDQIGGMEELEEELPGLAAIIDAPDHLPRRPRNA